jgi:MYXO-CTERM domain-containing protein
VVRAAADDPALPLGPVRGLVLLGFAAFAGLHWMALLEPSEPARAWQAVGIAALVVPALLGAARLRGPLRAAAAAVVALAALALGLLAGGIADEYLRPDRWGDLFAGVGRGLEALPGVRVPYRGLDEWTRTVIVTGGTLLVAAAALLAFWPRRSGTGFPAAAVLALVTLYVVPAVVLDFEGEFLRGAALALLLLAFLRLEKLRTSDVPAAGAGALAVAVLALAAAPALDKREPWFDYESWALETAGAKTVTFSWDHDYSPLDWPRDGRELLRVKARFPAYWKAADLDLFDGLTWRRDPRSRGERPTQQLPLAAEGYARWSQRITVTLRNLQTDTFLGAGITTDIVGMDGGYPIGGGVFSSAGGLGRGDSYQADVYSPLPSDRQLRATSTDYADWLRSYTSVLLPQRRRDDGTRQVQIRVGFPFWGIDDAEPEAERFGGPLGDASPELGRSELARTWALSRELGEGAESPFEYVQRVEAHLRDGYAYSEQPPATAETLDGFLFDAKIGFCQQFSGAEALLLRMGGIPARVATGFTTGSFDEKQREYVVRDLDAHSWVEVWFPEYGWVTRDPTPASAPPRAQPDEGELGGDGGSAGAPDLGGERLGDLESGRALAEDSGTSPVTYGIGGGAAFLALAGGAFAMRRRRRLRPPVALRPMADFERALRRARYDAAPGTTLSSMERTFAGWPGAAGYVRALREQRYSGRPAAPTAEQRRGLRAALARDAGTLRAWWALPPRRD